MTTFIFYYWLKNKATGNIIKIASEDYMGDINEEGIYKNTPVEIVDWVIEELNI